MRALSAVASCILSVIITQSTKLLLVLVVILEFVACVVSVCELSVSIVCITPQFLSSE